MQDISTMAAVYSISLDDGLREKSGAAKTVLRRPTRKIDHRGSLDKGNWIWGEIRSVVNKC